MAQAPAGGPVAAGEDAERGPGAAAVLLVEDLEQQRLQARSLAAVLEQAGFRTRLVSFGGANDIDTVTASARQADPPLIVCSVLFAGLVSEYLALVAALRGAGVTSHITMIGPLPAFAYADLLDACPGLDSVLRGEAEGGIVPLAQALDGAIAWSGVPGLAYRVPPGEAGRDGAAVHANALGSPVNPPAAWPAPVRDDVLPSFMGLGFATVEGSRGCYHACSFCLPCAAQRASGTPYRHRDVGGVVDELAALYGRGARLFLFDDEEFLPPVADRDERVRALEGELAGRGLRIGFTIKCRADDVEAGLFSRLKALGLLRVYVGIESGCEASLRLYAKGTSPADNVRALAALHQLGIVADFRSLIFHPWSSLDSLESEIGFLAEVLPSVSTCFDFHEVEAYPGTPLGQRLRAEGRTRGDVWPLPYEIGDPRVELLRRICRCAFGPGSSHARFAARMTEAWYAVLLGQRFGVGLPKASAGRLGALAASLNGACLGGWREMLAFARDGDVYDARRVNELAGRWAQDITGTCFRADSDLTAVLCQAQAGGQAAGNRVPRYP